ncbi:CvpA family protein [Pontibaca methylaminivorans]|uniref:Membrane protein required for colicin V production n=1 Tax=Pontibaca methylaminivorans TaxID=515897 RepID=A0A1R3WEH0_9RHOB|nr:CvpA family protein [Pontibaca methylaminivorans]SIT76345.1 membrane protein required for colicin V production [Pontibaca methylaminivorans]
MDGFTIIDGVVALIVVLSALLAYARGMVREALAIVGWIVAAVLGFLLAPQVEPLIREVPVIGDFIADSCELSLVAAFAAVFAVALILMSFFTPLFSSMIQRSALGGLDRGLGFLFGVARGVLLIAIAFFVYDTAFGGQNIAMIDDSRSAQVFARMTGQIEERNPERALGWLTRQYEELVAGCNAGSGASNDGGASATLPVNES